MIETKWNQLIEIYLLKGARTTESQVHRELASGLSVPVGFKNGTDGNISIAVDAIRAASSGHHFLSVTKQGLSAIVETAGNPSCHVILRGSSQGPNYDPDSVRSVVSLLKKAKLTPNLMIDCSHGNSKKNHELQSQVVDSLCEQMSTLAPDSTSAYIGGVMLESHLKAGRQNLTSNPSDLVYGQSITDACIGWEETVQVLDRLRLAVQERRRNSA